MALGFRVGDRLVSCSFPVYGDDNSPPWQQVLDILESAAAKGIPSQIIPTSVLIIFSIPSDSCIDQIDIIAGGITSYSNTTLTLFLCSIAGSGVSGYASNCVLWLRT